MTIDEALEALAEYWDRASIAQRVMIRRLFVHYNREELIPDWKSSPSTARFEPFSGRRKWFMFRLVLTVVRHMILFYDISREKLKSNLIKPNIKQKVKSPPRKRLKIGRSWRTFWKKQIVVIGLRRIIIFTRQCNNKASLTPSRMNVLYVALLMRA